MKADVVHRSFIGDEKDLNQVNVHSSFHSSYSNKTVKSYNLIFLSFQTCL